MTLRKKELDAGGISLAAIRYVNVCCVPFTRATFRCIAPTAWRERLEGASWKDVVELPWVWINQFNSYLAE